MGEIEEYWDPIKQTYRRRRGKRQMRHGPYSLEEKNLNAAYYRMMKAQRRMDGELAQIALRDLTVYLVYVTQVFERYSYNNVGDASGIDVEEFREELNAVAPATGDDTDVYEDIRDALELCMFHAQLLARVYA